MSIVAAITRAPEWQRAHIWVNFSDSKASTVFRRRSIAYRTPAVSDGARPWVSSRCLTNVRRSSSVIFRPWMICMRATDISQPSGVLRWWLMRLMPSSVSV